MSDYQTRLAEIRQRHWRSAELRPATTAEGVHHLALICSDIDGTIEFYQDLLGFPLVEAVENRDYPGSTHIFFDVGHDNLLAFFDFPGLGLGPAQEAHGGVQHIAISVTREAFDLLRSRLDEKNVDYIGPDRGLTNSMYFKDPDGIQIELLAEPLLQMDDRLLGRE